MVRVTSALPSAGRPDVPAKTTSSILPPRSGLTPCWPITQENASTTLDFPEPFGPTTQVMPGSKRRVVAEAKDLKPRSVRVFRYTACFSSSARACSQSPPGSTEPYRATRGARDFCRTPIRADQHLSLRLTTCHYVSLRNGRSHHVAPVTV